MNELTHFDAEGASRMVDVGEKPATLREAIARGSIRMSREALKLVRSGRVKKGDPLQAARLAGIMAAKRTAELIPLCHQVPLDAVSVEFGFPDQEHLSIQALARVTARTGVEMEALTAVSVTALTIYDMCKAVDRGMVIEQVQLEEKSGGRSGHYRREIQSPDANP